MVYVTWLDEDENEDERPIAYFLLNEEEIEE